MAEYIELEITALGSFVELGELDTWFEIADWAALWDFADESGSHAPLPRTDGDRPYERFRRSRDVTLAFRLRGDLTRSNVPVVGVVAQREQLIDHRNWLGDNVCGRSAAPDGTRDMTAHIPGEEATATVTVGRRLYLVDETPIEISGSLRLTLADGELTPAPGS